MADHTVRVDKFKWLRAQTEHFDIHYDKDSEQWLPLLARYLEDAWKNVGEKFNFMVPGRTPFFFYSDHNRFEQTNIVKIGEGTGGVTEAFKNRFLVFNDGSQFWLQHVIPHEFTHVVQFNVLYGGFWKSVRLLKSPFYPLWHMEGTAEYGSGEIDRATSELVIRDAVFHKTLPHLQELQGFSHLKPNQVTLGYKTGEAAIDFLVDEYGKDKAGKSLTLMKDYFEVSGMLVELLGCDLDMFDFRFREWLEDKYASFFEHAVEPGKYGDRLTFSDALPQFNESPVISPNGKTLYYIGDKSGPNFIYRLDLETKTTKTILKLDFGPFENINTKGRGLSVSKDGRWLAFAGEKKQKDFLYLYDLEKGKLKRVKVPFDQLRSPVFSPTEDSLVCIGMNKGVNDIYLINMKGKVLERLTDSLQDESDPVFSPDGLRIMFSGEVISAVNLNEISRDIFEINLADKSLRRVESLFGMETEPEYLGDGSILFIRDKDDDGNYGPNLFQYDVKIGSLTQKTNLIGGAFSPRYSPSDGRIYYIGYNGGEKHLYRFDLGISTIGGNELSLRAPPVGGESSTSKTEEISLNDGSDVANVPLEFLRQDLQMPLLTGASRPYRFRASTDFFLPFFFYSTLDGLVFADIWQASDYLGNHSLQQQMQYASGSDYLDMAAFYTYSRYRPNFTLGVRSQRYYKDFSKEDYRRDLVGIGFLTYPLDRVKAISLGLGTREVKETYFDDPEGEIIDKERFCSVGYSFDTVTGRYLMATRGHRFDIAFQQAFKTLDGTQEYKTGIAEDVMYFPLPRESTFVSRLMYGRSTGATPQVFRLGGLDRVRGLSGGDRNKKSNIVLTSFELRQRLKYLNYRTKWLFPDFFFKAAYLIVFNDFGYGWDNFQETNNLSMGEAFNSVGTGISWPLFILQTYQLDFSILWATQTNDSTQIWYVTIGPTF